MTATLAGNPPPDSAEWHALRRGSIGGSDIGSIVGVEPSFAELTAHAAYFHAQLTHQEIPL